MICISYICELIAQRRNELGMTQQQLAEGICQRSFISQIENGYLNDISMGILQKIVFKLGLSLDDLLKVERVSPDTLNSLSLQIKSCIKSRDYANADRILEEYNIPLQFNLTFNYYYYYKVIISIRERKFEEILSFYKKMFNYDPTKQNYVYGFSNSVLYILALASFHQYHFSLKNYKIIYTQEVLENINAVYNSLMRFPISTLPDIQSYILTHLSELYRIHSKLYKASQCLKRAEEIIKAHSLTSNISSTKFMSSILNLQEGNIEKAIEDYNISSLLLKIEEINYKEEKNKKYEDVLAKFLKDKEDDSD